MPPTAPSWHSAIVNGTVQQVWGYAYNGYTYPANQPAFQVQASPPPPPPPAPAPRYLFTMPTFGVLGGGCPGGRCPR